MAATLPLWRARVSAGAGQAIPFLFLLVLALEVVALMVRGINLGQHHVTAWNVASLMQRLGYLAAAGLVALGSSLRLTTVVECWALATTLSICVSGCWIWWRSPGESISLRVLLAEWAARFREGLRAFVTTALSLLLVRCDIWMLGPMLGFATVGQVSVATSLAEWLWYVPSILGNLLFAVVAADTSGRSPSQVAQAARAVTMLMAPALVVLLIAGRPLVTILYGPAYKVAGDLFMILIPGTAAIGMHLVVDSYFAGRGFPPITIWAMVASLCTKVALNLAVVPKLGASAAVTITSLVYLSLLAVKVVAFSRETKVSVASVFVPGPDDVQRLSRWIIAQLGVVLGTSSAR